LILQKKIDIIIVVGKEKGFAWGDKSPITTIGSEIIFYPENTRHLWTGLIKV
jgi:hypothetical protein